MGISWIQALLSSMFSALTVGIVLAIYKQKLDQNVGLTKEASHLRERNISDKIDCLSKDIKVVDDRSISLSVKFDELSKEFSRIDMKLAVVVSEQKHTVENLALLRGELEKVTVITSRDYGKVIRK